MTEEKLRDLKKGNIDSAIQSFKNSPTLKSKWLSCIPPHVAETRKVAYKFQVLISCRL